MSDAAAISRADLIAPEAAARWYEGAGIVEAAAGAVDGFRNEDFLTGFGNTAVVGLSTLGAIMDPFQAIFAAGVGWLMEHVDCLREPLDWLAGDPKEIEGHAATWQNLRQRTYDAAEYLASQVQAATSGWDSEAVTAYRKKASGMAGDAVALGAVADAMAEATLIAGSVVGVVRNTVRDLIAEVVGAAVSKALQALLVVTIPKVIAEIALMVAEYTGKIMRVLRRLTAAIDKLGGKFPALSAVCTQVSKKMDDVVSETSYGSLFLNSSKVHAADSYVIDSEGPLAAFKHAFGTMSQGDAVVYGAKTQIAADAVREGLKMNSIQNGTTTRDTLSHGKEPTPPGIDLPL
ncbi:hypothetical protein [Actinoplanes sp. NPDC051411]|uniref:hypothetical protein n=1 Tax=Actinoplanes sp. NPDC051411 TaxID=3155522 RepID=UPI00344AA2EC